MLSNYIKIARRHLLRDKMVGVISVISLSLGIGCAILVFVFVQQEWVRDDFHVNGDRVFRLHVTNASGRTPWEKTGVFHPKELATRPPTKPETPLIVRRCDRNPERLLEGVSHQGYLISYALVT